MEANLEAIINSWAMISLYMVFDCFMWLEIQYVDASRLSWIVNNEMAVNSKQEMMK